MNKFMQELDWISLIHSIRQLKFLQKMVMTEHQIILNKFSKENVLLDTPSIQKPKHLMIDDKNIKLPGMNWNKNWLEIDSYEIQVKQLTENLTFDYWAENDKWIIDQILWDKENIPK